MFHKAIKTKSRLRLALSGPSGSGKTYTALQIARGLGGRVALLDTERGSASKYADLFEFDVAELDSFAPENYIKAVQEAEKAGYDILIIDSLSHAWAGKDGLLEFVDKTAKGQFSGWKEATPKQNRLVDAILGARMHIIATMRAKMSYTQEKDEKTGKSVVRALGMQPVQRDGIEYEFDIFGLLDQSNTLVIQKSRAVELRGAVIEQPSPELGEALKAWLEDGVETPHPDKRLLDTYSVIEDILAKANELGRAKEALEVLMRHQWKQHESTDLKVARLVYDEIKAIVKAAREEQTQ